MLLFILGEERTDLAKVEKLVCVICGREYQQEETEYTCLSCGREGILDIRYDYDAVKKTVSRDKLRSNSDYSIWRYGDLLPLSRFDLRSYLQVGWTPIYRVERLAHYYGLKSILIKDDGRNPTASFKDRASAVGVVRALEKGSRTIACASTGNAASSLAGLSASVGLKSFIFVPQKAPQAKIAQLLIFGATVILVNGTYDQAYDLSMDACEEWGWYSRNCASNPYLVEGKKTVGLEICEQLDWEPPDVAIFSVGDGCTIAGAWKGFKEFYELGLTRKLPRMVGVQAEGACPVYRSFITGEKLETIVPDTIADSIAVGKPRNYIKALNSIRESGGTMVTVSDEEIINSIKVLGEKAGVFGEPAGVAGLAAIPKLLKEGFMEPGEIVCHVVTGNGLKDIQSALKAKGTLISVEPNIEDVREKLHQRTSQGGD